MASPRTESLHPDAAGIDMLPGVAALERLLAGQRAALETVAAALPALDAASALMAGAIASGGRLVYAGAGSSALMAMADALELPGTYGVDPDRILILMAGGLPRDSRMPGDTEDDAEEAARAAQAIRAGDLVIAVAASGATPYPMSIAREGRARGARVVAIANNPGAPIFELADVAVCLPTPPEVIAGSTRMGAGTAQKAALNLASTLMGIRLGQVHDGMMVGLVADNAKLRGRARGMVERIAGVTPGAADGALAKAAGAVKPAVLIARGMSADSARALLGANEGNLRAALARIDDPDRAARREDTNHGSEE